MAILDTGINNQRINKDFVTKKYNAINNSSKIHTSSTHASQIASIISYQKHKGRLIGLNKKVKIYDVKVLNDNNGGDIKDIIRGINWCIEQNVDIINMSFGFQMYNQELHKSIKKAKRNGIILVAASGNTMDINSDYPARFKEVYSVTAIDKNKDLFIYAPKKNIDYKAPGVNVYTLDSNDKLSKESGTSFAAAYFSSYLADNVRTKKQLSKILKEYPIK